MELGRREPGPAAGNMGECSAAWELSPFPSSSCLKGVSHLVGLSELKETGWLVIYA